MDFILHHLHLYFFFNATATTEIYTLSLHDALPISTQPRRKLPSRSRAARLRRRWRKRLHSRQPKQTGDQHHCARRSEEHTSELQSPDHLVCRLLLEKKKTR